MNPRNGMTRISSEAPRIGDTYADAPRLIVKLVSSRIS